MRMGLAIPALAVAATLAFLVLSGGDDPHRLRLERDNASGLIEGAPVAIGGVDAGRVTSISLDHRDRVVVELEIDGDLPPVGRGATAEVRASNLLGSKLVALDPGDPSDPLPPGAVIPPAEVAAPVDLQDVFDVLDADTRTRLAILINEAGLAVTGRRADFNTLLARLPSSLEAAQRLLEEVESDNQALAQVVSRTDSFLAHITPERRALGDLVRGFGGTFHALAERRTELRESLRRAPGTLRTLQALLRDLRATTVPLGPAAREIARSAPPLAGALAALPGFEVAARPALATAEEIAPRLTSLARGATPVLRDSVPLARELSGFSRDLDPATSALGLSADDLLATIEGWARAIQSRDGVSHFFRASLSVSPDLIQSALGKGEESSRRRTASRSRRASSRTSAREGSRPDARDREHADRDRPSGERPAVPDPEEVVRRVPQETRALLDFLLSP